MTQPDFIDKMTTFSKGYKIPRRSQIYVGFGCHQKCGFCYYKSKCNDTMFDRDYVLRQIDVELAYGIKDFEITGGEPSECNNLRYYCQYIKEKSPNSKIAVITNGGLWKNDIWDLIDEVLISYHLNKDSQDYDKSMFPLGSTFEKVMKTVEKARANNVIVRTNTVIGSFNFHNINDIIDDIIKYFKPDIINFLPVNLFSESDINGMSNYIDYVKLRPILKTQIDKIRKDLPKTLICVRYMPFCDMEGYEKYILGTLQHMYDFFDWNIELCGLNILQLIDQYSKNEDILKYLGKFGSTTHKNAIATIHLSYEKPSKCLGCKYFMICDGVEKTKDHILFNQVVPSRGSLITDFMQFIGNSTERKYKELYGIK